MGAKRRKIIDVQFYKSDTGSIPVKEWLKKLTAADRKNIGDDIRTIEFGWPIGMPLVEKIDTTYGKSVPIYQITGFPEFFLRYTAI
jgi:hypothetical protein